MGGVRGMGFLDFEGREFAGAVSPATGTGAGTKPNKPANYLSIYLIANDLNFKNGGEGVRHVKVSPKTTAICTTLL